MKIIFKFNMFTKNQHIYVMNDRETVERIAVNAADLDKIAETLVNLSISYDTVDIELAGPKSFTMKIAEKCYQAEITKYNKNKIDIKYI